MSKINNKKTWGKKKKGNLTVVLEILKCYKLYYTIYILHKKYLGNVERMPDTPTEKLKFHTERRLMDVMPEEAS